jgi:uncharacterized Zn-finger protein
MHFSIGCLVGLAFQLKYSLTKVQNFVASFKNCVKNIKSLYNFMRPYQRKWLNQTYGANSEIRFV